MSSLEHDLALLIHRYPTLTGREFVETALRVAEAYFAQDELPTLVDAGELAEALREAFAQDTPCQTH